MYREKRVESHRLSEAKERDFCFGLVFGIKGREWAN